MVSRRRWKLAFASCLLLLVPACTSGDRSDETTTSTIVDGGPSPTPAPDETTTTVGEPVRLVLWVDEVRAPVVETAAGRFSADTGIEVEVQAMSFFDIREAVLSAAPAGEGPDLFIDSNEGTGELVEAGVVAALDFRSGEDRFLPVALDAFAYEGEVYALPVAVEAVALYYNRGLVPEPPGDFEELTTRCDTLGFPTEEGLPCLGIPAGEVLHQFPFLGGFGGYLFGFENRSYDFGDVGIDSPGAVAGAVFMQDLYRDGYALASVDYSEMADLFNRGAIPFMWTGPWQLGAVEAAGVDFAVVPLPRMAGNSARPLVGSQGFFLNAFSEASAAAVTFLFEHLDTPDTVAALAGAAGRVPARADAAIEEDGEPVPPAFLESASDGVPFPNFPELGSVWGPLSEALAAISGDSGDPAGALETAAAAVRAAFAGS